MSKHIGHEFSGNLDRDKLVKKLLSLFADEWVAAYYYMYTAMAVKGPNSEEIAELFMREAKEEINKHANMIAQRLQELDVEPPKNFKELYDISGCKYPELPEDPYDIDGFIIAAIKAEICAIKGYKDLYDFVHGPDPVTEELAEELIKDETRHRTELYNLLSRDGVKRLEKELEKM